MPDPDSTAYRIAILAGGESRRMGRDKAKLDFRGEQLLERIAGEAMAVAPTTVLGRDDAEAFDLPEVEFLPDREPDLGPIGGLRTALAAFEEPVAVLGCDMPLVDAGAIRWLIDAYESAGAPEGLVAEAGGDLQPLFAVYTRAVDRVAEAMIEEGERSLRRLCRRAGLPVREVPKWVAEQLVNVNTPEEFRALED